MPRGDRTGPYGEGPKTGRQMGYCVGNEHPGFINMGQNRGRGFGRRFQGGLVMEEDSVGPSIRAQATFFTERSQMFQKRQ